MLGVIGNVIPYIKPLIERENTENQFTSHLKSLFDFQGYLS